MNMNMLKLLNPEQSVYGRWLSLKVYLHKYFSFLIKNATGINQGTRPKVGYHILYEE